MTIFPGITAEYVNLECERVCFEHEPHPNVMEINHCHYGRFGWELNNGVSIYVGEGDTTMNSCALCSESKAHFPLGFFQGITINVDFDVLKENPPKLLSDAEIDYDAIRQNYCRTNQCITFQAGSVVDQILHSLYHLPENLVESYLKIKVIELILYLSQQLTPSEVTNTYSSDVVDTIYDIHGFLTDHLETRYTITDLSAKFLINTSTLKDAFKVVYGTPIGTYMKEYRLRHAAKLLKHTDASIAEIAESVGYETASKFTKAFKEVFGVRPSEYRK